MAYDGSIRFDTKIDQSKLPGQLNDVKSKIKDAFSSIRDIMQGPVQAIKEIGSALGALKSQVDKLESSWGVQAEAVSVLEATLKATGATAWTSSKAIQEMASQFQGMTKYGDETVLTMQNVLLGFKNITGENFEEASLQILNMATVMKMDLTSAAQAVGKALDDPIEGINSLSRQGFRFSETQKDMLAAMVNTGNIAGAQKIILDELATTYGGAAEAAAKTSTAINDQLNNAIGDFNEQLGRVISEGLYGFRKSMLESVNDLVKWSSEGNNLKNTLAGIGTALGIATASISTFLLVAGGASTAVGGLTIAFKALTASILANPLALAVSGVVALTASIIAFGQAEGQKSIIRSAESIKQIGIEAGISSTELDKFVISAKGLEQVLQKNVSSLGTQKELIESVERIAQARGLEYDQIQKIISASNVLTSQQKKQLDDAIAILSKEQDRERLLTAQVITREKILEYSNAAAEAAKTEAEQMEKTADQAQRLLDIREKAAGVESTEMKKREAAQVLRDSGYITELEYLQRMIDSWDRQIEGYADAGVVSKEVYTNSINFLNQYINLLKKAQTPGTVAIVQGTAPSTTPSSDTSTFNRSRSFSIGDSGGGEAQTRGIGDVLSWVTGKLGETLKTFADFAKILDPIGTVVSAIGKTLEPVVSEMMQPLVGMLEMLGTAIGQILAPAIQLLTPIIMFIVEVFKFLYNNIVVPVGNAIIEFFNGLYNAIAGLVNAIIDLLNNIPGVNFSRVEAKDKDTGKLTAITTQDIQTGDATTQATELAQAIKDINEELKKNRDLFKLASNASLAYKTVLNNVTGTVNSFFKSLQNIGTGIADTLVDNLINGFSKDDFLFAMEGFITESVIKAAVFTDSFMSKVSEIGAKIAQGIAGGFTQTGLEDLKGQLGSLYTSAATAAETATSLVSSAFNSYDGGTLSVRGDQLANIHNEEMILTQGISEEARARGIMIAPINSLDNIGGTGVQSGMMIKLDAMGIINIDGREIGRVAFNFFDEFAGASYGS